ncbi:MAG TPA: DUF2252 domain-containing protein [Ktedonobacterales bacterium]
MTTIERAPVVSRSATRAERYAFGKSLRTQVPHNSHGEWAPASDRPDPTTLLKEQDRTRLPELVPIRMGRMSLSPFAFLRGAAAVMASDLATTPVSGITVQLCGDAHVSNFGGFATPERELVFDVNDFDETLPGAWEWDLKRMAASIVVAGRGNGYSAHDIRQTVVKSIQQYQTVMHRGVSMTCLDVWYAHIDAEHLSAHVKHKEQDRILKDEKRASHHTNEGVFPKLAEVVDGHYRIKDEPPLIVHVQELGKTQKAQVEEIKGQFEAYAQTLPDDRKVLLSKYRIVDIALKVVGVGSVGTRCWVVLLMAGGDGDDPLFLQVKEADASTLEPYFGKSVYANHGERVVQGQLLMQETSDIFLGWTRGKEVDLYVRQLRDMKFSADIATMTKKMFDSYTWLCASALARAHGRSGDPAQISGYMGHGTAFAQAIARFAETYADQTERDHAALLAAIKKGRIQAKVDV